jgi:hypothetical protein
MGSLFKFILSHIGFIYILTLEEVGRVYENEFS